MKVGRPERGISGISVVGMGRRGLTVEKIDGFGVDLFACLDESQGSAPSAGVGKEVMDGTATIKLVIVYAQVDLCAGVTSDLNGSFGFLGPDLQFVGFALDDVDEGAISNEDMVIYAEPDLGG